MPHPGRALRANVIGYKLTDDAPAILPNILHPPLQLAAALHKGLKMSTVVFKTQLHSMSHRFADFVTDPNINFTNTLSDRCFQLLDVSRILRINLVLQDPPQEISWGKVG